MIHVDKPKEAGLKKDWDSVIKSAYVGKCAFCEQREEKMEIDHYRPQKTYSWLINSWNNLLLSCPKCNGKKSDKFPIKGTKINNSIPEEIYDSIEQPLLINPENEAKPEIHFSFGCNGEITHKTKSERGEKTIEICDLNRKYLIEKRKAVYDLLKANIQEYKLMNNYAKIREIVEKFIFECREKKVEFIAFRLSILQNEIKKLV